jgi:transposase-like protein
MTRGRPPEGPKLVERLDGSPQAKQRLAVILQTITGETTVEAACAELDIGEAAFHKLRQRTLQDAVTSLEPRPAGRPPTPVSPEAEQVTELQKQMRELKIDLRAAQIRTEIALTMPHLLLRNDPAAAAKKKTPEKTPAPPDKAS